MTAAPLHVALVASALAALIGGNAARADEPTGTITGSVVPAGGVASVFAVDRSNDKKYAGAVDKATGVFSVGGLPVGGVYDCVIDFQDASRLEGVNMKVPRSEYEEEQPLSPEDADAIKEKVQQLNKFEDEVKILAVSGNIQNAAVVVNKLRTRPFVNSKPGEVVWRCELWRFERPEETWVKVQDDLFLVLYRERIQRDVYAKKSVTLDPVLGGLEVTRDAPTVRLGPVKPPPGTPGVRFRTAQAEGRP